MLLIPYLLLLQWLLFSRYCGIVGEVAIHSEERSSQRRLGARTHVRKAQNCNRRLRRILGEAAAQSSVRTQFLFEIDTAECIDRKTGQLFRLQLTHRWQRFRGLADARPGPRAVICARA